MNKLKNVLSTIPILRRSYSMFEPPYLEQNKSKYPLYDTITVQIKGYDFPPVEAYQAFIHSLSEYLNVKVELSWAQPAKHYKVERYKPGHMTIHTEYSLKLYERNLKLVNISTTKLPLLLEIFQSALPEGIILNVFPFDEAHEKERYVPDHELEFKMKMLNELGGPPDPNA